MNPKVIVAFERPSDYDYHHTSFLTVRVDGVCVYMKSFRTIGMSPKPRHLRKAQRVAKKWVKTLNDGVQ